MKKNILKLCLALLLFLGVSSVTTYAATAPKTAGITIPSDYTWVLGNLEVFYNESTKKIEAANVNILYRFPGATVNQKGVTKISTYTATGRIIATVGSVQKTSTATINTNS